jgi:hypothetical protein
MPGRSLKIFGDKSVFPENRALRLFLGSDFAGGFHRFGLGSFEQPMIILPAGLFQAIHAFSKSFRQASLLWRQRDSPATCASHADAKNRRIFRPANDARISIFQGVDGRAG